MPSSPMAHKYVAPLAGSVDRNQTGAVFGVGHVVAPLAGSVDRNIILPENIFDQARRSPRGERG